MSQGKLPNEQLQALLSEYVHANRKEVLLGARMGMDTAILDFQKDLIVVSTDPITGSASNLGSLAVDISVNDVSTSGADPVGVLITILAPEGASLEEIREIFEEASARCDALDIEIVGGHTEVTNAVNRFLVSTTVIGRLKEENRLRTEEVKEGDLIYVSKHLGLEGSAILAYDEPILEDLLSPEELEEAKSYANLLSVREEGRLGRDVDALFMHDVTEGGIKGAVYETAMALEKGILCEEESIPLTQVTRKICQIFEIDPFRLISSGSMLFVIRKEREEDFVRLAEKRKISVTRIGRVIPNQVLWRREGREERLPAPTKDHLYLAKKKEWKQ